MPRQVLDNKGFTTFLAVLIVSAIGLAIVTSVSLLTFSSSRLTRILYGNAQSRQLAHGCAELGLMAIRENTSFTGSATSSVLGFSCEYIVTNTGGNTRRVQASSTVQQAVHRVQVDVSQLSPQIQVSSWEEIPSF